MDENPTTPNIGLEICNFEDEATMRRDLGKQFGPGESNVAIIDREIGDIKRAISAITFYVNEDGDLVAVMRTEDPPGGGD